MTLLVFFQLFFCGSLKLTNPHSRMSVPFHRAFEGEGSSHTFYETTFRNLRACTDVKVVFYALFYVFLVHFRIDLKLLEQCKGAMVRSRTRWYNEEGMGTSYFLGLERLNCSNKTMKTLIKEDGTILRDQKKILLEQVSFYKKLYTSRPDIYFSYINSEKVFTKEQKENLDKNISFNEFSNAIHQMNNNKSPGLDGLPIEVYKVFFKLIGKTVYNAILKCIDNAMLTRSMRRGLLVLIPKKDRDISHVKNWHPLTLMNTDHKILSKILANRMKPVLNSLIGTQQSGYMEGRFIGNNNRTMIDIIEYCDQRSIDVIMISVNFEKCFDTIEFQAIEGALNYYGFGHKFIDMIMLLYTDFQTAVVHNGHISDWFTRTRAIHQGCAISGYIFLLNAEILANKIQNNANIQKIPIQE